MYNNEIAKLSLNQKGPIEYLKGVQAELASGIALLRTGSEDDNWFKIGEGMKRVADCQIAVKAYVDMLLSR